MNIDTPEQVDEFNEELATVLKLRRVEIKMTVGHLAEASGITQQTVGRYLRGERTIHVAHFVALTKVLRLEPGDALATVHERMWDAS